jgi:hypothetical protein
LFVRDDCSGGTWFCSICSFPLSVLNSLALFLSSAVPSGGIEVDLHVSQHRLGTT